MVPHVPSPPAAPPPPHLSRVTRRGHHHQLSLPLLHQAPTISWDFVFLSPLLFKTEVGVFAHRHTRGQVFALVAAVLHLPPVVWSCGFADTRSAGCVRSLLVPHRARVCPPAGGHSAARALAATVDTRCLLVHTHPQVFLAAHFGVGSGFGGC